MYRKPVSKLIGKMLNGQNAKKITQSRKMIQSHYFNKFRDEVMNATKLDKLLVFLLILTNIAGFSMVKCVYVKFQNDIRGAILHTYIHITYKHTYPYIIHTYIHTSTYMLHTIYIHMYYRFGTYDDIQGGNINKYIPYIKKYSQGD